jgi:hypothetical protein
MGRNWLLLILGIGIICITSWFIYSYNKAEGFQVSKNYSSLDSVSLSTILSPTYVNYNSSLAPFSKADDMKLFIKYIQGRIGYTDIVALIDSSATPASIQKSSEYTDLKTAVMSTLTRYEFLAGIYSAQKGDSIELINAGFMTGGTIVPDQIRQRMTRIYSPQEISNGRTAYLNELESNIKTIQTIQNNLRTTIEFIKYAIEIISNPTTSRQKLNDAEGSISSLDPEYKNIAFLFFAAADNASISGGNSSSYTIIDSNLIQVDTKTFATHVKSIYTLQSNTITAMLLDLSGQLAANNKEVTTYCAQYDNMVNSAFTGGSLEHRCRNILPALIDSLSKEIGNLNNLLLIVNDSQQNWLDMITLGSPNFINDFTDMIEPLPAAQNVSFPTPNIPNIKPTFTTILTGKQYSRNVRIVGTISSMNTDEINKSVFICKNVWLAVPNNLEKYIYIAPSSLKVYMRSGTSPDVSTGVQKNAIFNALTAFIKGVTITRNAAEKAYNEADADINAAAATIVATLRAQLQQAQTALASAKANTMTVTFNPEKIANAQNAVDSLTSAIDAAQANPLLAAAQKLATDANNSILISLLTYKAAVAAVPDLPGGASSLIGGEAMAMIRNTLASKTKAAADTLIQAVARNVVAASMTPWSTGQTGSPLFFDTGSGKYLLNPVSVALNTLFLTKEITPDLMALMPPPMSRFITQYVSNRGSRIQSYMTGVTNSTITPIQPTKYFITDLSDNSVTYDQIAQGFYDLGDGTKAFSYIYDIFPIGTSILDVRADITTNNKTFQSQLQGLQASYRRQLSQPMSASAAADALETYQKNYADLLQKQDTDVTVKMGATRRLFYTQDASGIRITGFAVDDIAASSFYNAYNGGLDTPTQDSPGNLNYAPLIQYTKNPIPTLDCTSLLDLQMVTAEYIAAITNEDISGDPVDPWDGEGDLFVTTILGVKQVPGSLSADIHWREVAYDSGTNEPGKTVDRWVNVVYKPNYDDWYSYQILFDPSDFKFYSHSKKIPDLQTPITIPKPYIDDGKLGDGGVCKSVSCSDPATLYKMVDDYNTDSESPGIILKVFKVNTMNSSQCDIVADIDYTTSKGDPDKSKKGKVLRDMISLYLTLDVGTCTYDYGGSDKGYGIQDNAPGMSTPFEYVSQFTSGMLTSLTSATNTVLGQVGGAMTLAQKTLAEYRASSYAGVGDLETFKGCPTLRCHDVRIMNKIFQYYASKNTGTTSKNTGTTMYKILKIGATPFAPNSCDVLFEKAMLNYIDTTGEIVIDSKTIQTSSVRMQFTPTSGSSYDSILDAKIAAASGTQRTALEQQKAALNAAITCKFDVSSYIDLNPVDPSAAMPTWPTVSDASNTSISVLNPMKKGTVNYINPYKLPGGKLTLETASGPKCQRMQLKDISNVLLYWGYDQPYAIGNIADGNKTTSDYEIRITDQEFLPFSDTYQIFTLYRDSNCNPVIKDMRNSIFPQSALAFKVTNSADTTYIPYVHSYFTDKLKPSKVLGSISKAGYDYDKNSTGLVYYGVSMATYDADGFVSAFNGTAGNVSFPLAYIACEFRQHFKGTSGGGTSGIYVANVYFLPGPPAGITMDDVSDPKPVALPDPYATLTQYKLLRFTPTAVRSKGATAQLQRIEFYSDVYLTNVINPRMSFPGAAEVYTPDPGVRKSVKGGAEFLYANDGVNLTEPDKNEIFVWPVGTAITVQSDLAIAIDGLAFITGDDTACDVVAWTLEGSMNGGFWKPIFSQGQKYDQMSYPAYGYWRTSRMGPAGATPLPQNPNRLKGFLECGVSLATLDFVNQASAVIYTGLSQQYFATGTAEPFDPKEKNVKRAYLTDISGMFVDDLANTIYLQPKIQILRATYKLMSYSSAILTVSYLRSRNCRFTYSITVSTPTPLPAYAYTPFPKLVLGQTQTAPYAWGGYPAALPSKYTRLANKNLQNTSPDGANNIYSVKSFISNGPDRAATITLPAAVKRVSNMDAEGLAQMCADNVDCIGFNYRSADSSGTFFTDPVAGTILVTSVDTTDLYVKKGYLLIQYVKLTGLKTRDPAATTIAVSKIGFYKGQTLIKNSPQFINLLGADGSVLNTPSVYDTGAANLFNYTAANSWKSPLVDGISMQFASPLVMSGYTLVTSPDLSAYDPVSWTLQVSSVGGDDPTNWTTLDTQKGFAAPEARQMAYPIIYFNGQPQGTSTDFVPKMLSSCSDPQLVSSMVELYKQQKGLTTQGTFNVSSVGILPGGECVLGYNTATNIGTQYAGIKFASVFGDIVALTGKNNMTVDPMKLASIPTMSSLPFVPTTPIRYARFIPTAISGKGTAINLTGVFLLRGGNIVTPISSTNPLATKTPPNPTAVNAMDPNLTNYWSDAVGGYLILDYGTGGKLVDSFTLFTGSIGATGSPTRWTLEVSADGWIWQLAHAQATDVTVPTTAKTQYPVYSFTSGTTTTTNIMAKSIGFAGKSCGSQDILNIVNDAAFAKTPSILFNPVSAVYTDSANTCDYTQGDDGTILKATFSTGINGTTTVQSLARVSSAAPGTSVPITGPVFESSIVPPVDCDASGLLTALDSFYRNTGINSNKIPLVATESGRNSTANACVFALDSQFAPLVSGKPVNQVGFQFEPRFAGNPRTITKENTKLDTTPAGVTMTTAKASAPYKYIRFKVLNTGSDAAGVPVMIGGFDFFKATNKLTYSATITNPLGTGGTDLTKWNDTNRKPIQFSFISPGLDFDGYSWTSSSAGAIGVSRAQSDPVSWDLQASMNGILWTTIDSVRGAAKLTDANSGFRMPIYKIGANGAGAVARDAISAPAKTYTVDCKTAWPTAFAAYKALVQGSDIGGSDPGNTIKPKKYGYDSALNQCAYKFDDQENFGADTIVGFRFVPTAQTPTIDTKKNVPSDSNNVTVIAGVVVDLDDFTTTPLNTPLNF